MCNIIGCDEIPSIKYSMLGKQINSYQSKKVTHYICPSCAQKLQSGKIWPRFSKYKQVKIESKADEKYFG